MKRTILKNLILAAFFIAPSASFAATVTLERNDLDAVSTTAISGYTTNGADMDGMHVTAYFDGRAAQSSAFMANGSSSGIAQQDGFTLSLSGYSTFSSPFVLTSTRYLLTALQLVGISGDTIFDTVGTSTGTSGSANGRPFSTTSNTVGDIAVTYSRPVSLTGAAHAGDLYATMLVDFTGIGGLSAGQTLSFVQDTDNTAIAGDITPNVSAVPLPAGLFLLLNAAAAFGIASRFKAKKSLA